MDNLVDIHVEKKIIKYLTEEMKVNVFILHTLEYLRHYGLYQGDDLFAKSQDQFAYLQSQMPPGASTKVWQAGTGIFNNNKG